MKNIVLFGGSNSVRKNGLSLGLKEGVEAWNSALASLQGDSTDRAQALHKLARTQPSLSLSLAAAKLCI